MLISQQPFNIFSIRKKCQIGDSMDYIFCEGQPFVVFLSALNDKKRVDENKRFQ